MKKVFFFAAMAAMMLASCGNKTQANASASDSDSVATEQTSAADASQTNDAALTTNLSAEGKAAVEQLTSNLQKAIESKDSKAAATTLAQIHTKYKELVEQGKLDEAKAYGSAIQAFVDKNAASLKNIANGNTSVVDLVNGIANLPTSANATIDEAKAAAENTVKDAANQAVSNAKTAAKNTVNKAVNDAKTAAANKVNCEISKAASSASAAKAKADAKAAEAKAQADAAKQKAADAINKAANTKLKELIK